MFIQTESTPNPATLKFLPGQAVLDAGTADFPSAEGSESSPLAQRIFAVQGVTAVFFGTDFVTVTKAEATQWDHIKQAILGAIMEHYQSGKPVVEGAAAAVGHATTSGGGCAAGPWPRRTNRGRRWGGRPGCGAPVATRCACAASFTTPPSPPA